MNGNARLYRSTSDGMIGGVCAGLANYFHIDPTLVRLAFLLLSLFTGGAFVVIYLIMWVLIPTVGSTAGTPNQIMQENMNEISARVRGYTGGSSNPTNGGGVATNGGPATNGGATNGGATNGGATNGTQVQLQQYAGPTTQARPNNAGTWLILIGAFFLLANFGFFHAIHWAMWWPLLLIGFGFLIFARRHQP